MKLFDLVIDVYSVRIGSEIWNIRKAKVCKYGRWGCEGGTKLCWFSLNNIDWVQDDTCMLQQDEDT